MLGQNFYFESSEALAQVAYRRHGCPIPESMENQGGWDFEQPGPVMVSLPMAAGLELDDY